MVKQLKLGTYRTCQQRTLKRACIYADSPEYLTRINDGDEVSVGVFHHWLRQNGRLKEAFAHMRLVPKPHV